MTGWFMGRMAALDLETDGPRPEEAHIVTACVAIIDGSGQNAPDVTSWVLKTRRPIPAEAAEIHGYTTERADTEGRDPAECVKEIATALGKATADGIPLVAFNAVFDLTCMDREMRRLGLGSITPDGLQVVDPFCIDKALDKFRSGKRTLTATCEHYGVSLDGAHDATFDAIAAARLAWKIARTNPQIARLSLDELHKMQVRAKHEQDIDLAAYFRRLARQKRNVEDQVALNAARPDHRRVGGGGAAPGKKFLKKSGGGVDPRFRRST
ncbi:hypothetical protein BJF79_46210 [Actinomadura sp. CNU-125]|uniref:exonuclease domain-containing protein n=1 Tax=Actinomadura sp. CNU-125 TaxID=1904961 RepID=UPI00095ECD54|nr:exonuclease domain-containing protein [Actinomadura sp. CNU-125]OLT22880.1 hypothetical protein BJF79_46210 [Actinomadura sp. CNU-125]